MSPVSRAIRRIPQAVLTTALFVSTATVAAAQTLPTGPIAVAEPAPHAGSWEVSGGLVWQGGFDLGSGDAELTRNPTTGTGPFDLFASSTSLGSGYGLQGRVAGYLSSRLALEGGARFTRPRLKIDLSGDFESASNQTAEETLTQYVIDGSVLWHFGNEPGGRVVPFAGAGGGYVRDLHEDNELMETGFEYHALGGVKIWFGDRPGRLGLRAEVGVSLRDGGFGTTDDSQDEGASLPDLKSRRTVPFAGVSLVFLF